MANGQMQLDCIIPVQKSLFYNDKRKLKASSGSVTNNTTVYSPASLPVDGRSLSSFTVAGFALTDRILKQKLFVTVVVHTACNWSYS